MGSPGLALLLAWSGWFMLGCFWLCPAGGGAWAIAPLPMPAKTCDLWEFSSRDDFLFSLPSFQAAPPFLWLKGRAGAGILTLPSFNPCLQPLPRACLPSGTMGLLPLWLTFLCGRGRGFLGVPHLSKLCMFLERCFLFASVKGSACFVFTNSYHYPHWKSSSVEAHNSDIISARP